MNITSLSSHTFWQFSSRQSGSKIFLSNRSCRFCRSITIVNYEKTFIFFQSLRLDIDSKCIPPQCSQQLGFAESLRIELGLKMAGRAGHEVLGIFYKSQSQEKMEVNRERNVTNKKKKPYTISYNYGQQLV